MNINETLKWIRETPAKDLPYNSTGIGWGPKTVNGKETGEYSLIFLVENKKPLEELSKEEIIPKYFSLSSYEVSTDVQIAEVHNHLLTDCHDVNNNVLPLILNRKRTRPLVAGSEAMCIHDSSVATLGTFVIDKNDGQVVALSNNHVFAASQTIARYYVGNLLTGNTNTKNISGFQPSGYYSTTPSNDFIGTCKVPVVIGNENSNKNYLGWYEETTCDAATLKLSNYNLINSTSIIPWNFNGKPPYQFATDEEIDSLLNVSSPNYGAPIFRSGRTCGPVGYPGNTYSCSLSAYQFADTAVSGYNGYISIFSNCIYIRGNVVPVRGGDSGSALYALFNQQSPSLSAWKLIGLVFAGPSGDFPEYGIGCRITPIVEELNIAPWDGVTIPSLSSRPLYTVTTDLSSATITLSGRKFYQIGGTQSD